MRSVFRPETRQAISVAVARQRRGMTPRFLCFSGHIGDEQFYAVGSDSQKVSWLSPLFSELVIMDTRWAHPIRILMLRNPAVPPLATRLNVQLWRLLIPN
ncbi:hypothetical protein LZ32DRAFT_125872 [Colletotrichum eremochloae]|nr:hypothetical protein LZ32DRAFT_125872 [Colletotrichum eremochloae]